MALGRKTGGGSRAGKPNKSTADVKALAGEYAEAAMKELGRLALKAKNEAVRVAAAKEILDRRYGKSKQPIVGGEKDDEPIRHALDPTGLTEEQLLAIASIKVRASD